MRFSNIYLAVTAFGLMLALILALVGQFSVVGVPLLISVVFFVVFLLARTFEMVQEIEAKNRRSYEEMEEIFKRKFSEPKKPRAKPRKKVKK